MNPDFKLLCILTRVPKEDKTAPEAINSMKQAYKEKCFRKSLIFRWHPELKEILWGFFMTLLSTFMGKHLV